jgi:hypothetical protein
MKTCILAIAALALATACQKENDTVMDTCNEINAEITQGEVYTYDLHTQASANAQITSEPTNARTSRISPNGNTTVYEYAPSANFTGTEHVTIVTGQSKCGNKEKSRSSCGKKERKCGEESRKVRERITHKLTIRVRGRNSN